MSCSVYYFFQHPIICWHAILQHCSNSIHVAVYIQKCRKYEITIHFEQKFNTANLEITCDVLGIGRKLMK